MYCATCILHWALHKEEPWCPQCKHPFTHLLTYRTLEGELQVGCAGGRGRGIAPPAHHEGHAASRRSVRSCRLQLQRACPGRPDRRGGAAAQQTSCRCTRSPRIPVATRLCPLAPAMPRTVGPAHHPNRPSAPFLSFPPMSIAAPQDFPSKELVCMLKRAQWFQEHLRFEDRQLLEETRHADAMAWQVGGCA